MRQVTVSSHTRRRPHAAAFERTTAALAGFVRTRDCLIEAMCADLGNQLEADRLAGWDMPDEQKQQIRETW